MSFVPGIPRSLLLLLGMVGGVAGSAVAFADVIYDTGHTEPLAPYFKPLEKVQQAARIRTPRQHQPPFLRLADLVKHLFPLETPEMQPGPLETPVPDETVRRRFAVGGVTFFLLGSDPLSRAWLQQHRAALRERGAVGVVVEANSLSELHALQRLGRGLPIVPLPGRAFYEQLGITRYPVLISQEGLQQ